MAKSSSYRGRLAPSPTGYLHLGHARTFWVAWQRARAAHGKLIFRNEDLDYQRCKPEFVRAMYEDLHWLGLDWDEGRISHSSLAKAASPWRAPVSGGRLWAVFAERTPQLLSRRMAQAARQRIDLSVYVFAERFGASALCAA